MVSSDNPFDAALAEALRGLDLAPTAAELRSLRRHFDALIEANRTTNLTRITDPREAAIRHYADSLAILAWIRRDGPSIRTVLDVGPGAGFPSVPVAVMRPDWFVTALEATRKKVEFIQAAARSLHLDNLETIHAHSEHWTTQRRFDLVTCRALAPGARAIHLTSRFVAAEGWLVLYQTPSGARATNPGRAPPRTRRHLVQAAPFPYELRLRGKLIHRVLLVFRHSD